MDIYEEERIQDKAHENFHNLFLPSAQVFWNWPAFFWFYFFSFCTYFSNFLAFLLSFTFPLFAYVARNSAHSILPQQKNTTIFILFQLATQQIFFPFSTGRYKSGGCSMNVVTLMMNSLSSPASHRTADCWLGTWIRPAWRAALNELLIEVSLSLVWRSSTSVFVLASFVSDKFPITSWWKYNYCVLQMGLSGIISLFNNKRV